MYNYTTNDIKNQTEYWEWLASLLEPKPKASAVAQVDPVKPSYYPKPDVFTYAKAHGLDPIEFSVVKYVTRWRKKNGLEDLKKARQCLDRLIESASQKA